MLRQAVPMPDDEEHLDSVRDTERRERVDDRTETGVLQVDTRASTSEEGSGCNADGLGLARCSDVRVSAQGVDVGDERQQAAVGNAGEEVVPVGKEGRQETFI
jgi:hypothetical protein